MQPETLGHILGICIHTKAQRIKRHDDIKNLIAEKLASKDRHQVLIEPQIQVGANLFKPDLVIKNEEKVFVADITVRFENRDYLQLACDEKIHKYRECLRIIKQRYGSREGAILPVVVGSRGTIPASTKKNLKELKIKESEIKTIALIALRSSIEIANAFIDYNEKT